jgi:hypothetical protein
MTIGPTIAGGLKLVPEEEQDWEVLLEIANDGKGGLAGRLGGLMDEDAMWEEIVVPELEETFSRQRLEVVRAVMKAREANEPVHIDRESADTWYGALNQARLELEAKYHFGPSEDRNPEKMTDREAKAAYYRNEFYGAVQTLLLQYVFPD